MSKAKTVLDMFEGKVKLKPVSRETQMGFMGGPPLRSEGEIKVDGEVSILLVGDDHLSIQVSDGAYEKSSKNPEKEASSLKDVQTGDSLIKLGFNKWEN